MKIEIVGVNAFADGSEILLTVKISDGEKSEKRRLVLFTDSYLELGLSKGELLSEELFDKLCTLSERCRAIKKGSELLAYSAQSKAKLAYKLKAKGFDKESADEAVEYLSEKNFINEEKSVEKLVSACLKKLWGKKRIYAELVKKGYPKDLVAEAVSRIEGRIYLKNCKALIAKKWGTLTGEPAELNKIINALIRYGYSYSEIQNVINK